MGENECEERGVERPGSKTYETDVVRRQKYEMEDLD
jgi:hypothetical protein